MKQILTIIFLLLCLNGISQTKYDTVNLKGINYCVFRGAFIWEYVYPPDSLPDGHWIGYYPNKRVAFTGEYKNGKPYDTIKIYREHNDSIKNISNIDNIEELFYFQDGRAKYYEFRILGRVNHPEWKIEQSRNFNKSNDTIVEIVYNDNDKLCSKDTFVLLKNEFTERTFFRIGEWENMSCKQVIRCNYNENGKLKYKDVTNYYIKGYNSVSDYNNARGKLQYKKVINYYGDHADVDSTTKCYDNKGILITCPLEKDD